MARYGYMLLDQTETDVSRQALQLDGIGGFDRIFVDRQGEHKPGREPRRTQRQQLLQTIKPDDVIYAAAADRLFDHLRDFAEVWTYISQRQAALVLLEENIDTRSPAGRTAVAALQAFEKLDFAYHSKRKKAGIKAARESGRRIGRPPVKVPPHFRDICQAWSENKITGQAAAEKAGLKHTSFYKKANELGFKAPQRPKRNH